MSDIFSTIVIFLISLIAIISYLNIKNNRIQKEYLDLLSKIYQNFNQELRDASLQNFIFSKEGEGVYEIYKQYHPVENKINETLKNFILKYNKEMNKYINKNKISPIKYINKNKISPIKYINKNKISPIKYINKNKISPIKNINKSEKIHNLKPYEKNIWLNIYDGGGVIFFVLIFTYPFWLSLFFNDDTKAKTKYHCQGKEYCYEMTSCSEANFYMNKCGVDRLDGDEDGTPCEGTLCY